MRLLTLILIGIIVAIEGRSCQCLPVSFDQEIRASELIFHGRVINVTDYTFIFEIIELWKGNPEVKEVTVNQGQTSCEKMMFQLEKNYVVYLKGSSVGNCSRTTEYSISVDPERLDLIFKNIGSKDSIESQKLTEREFSLLKKALESVGIIYPGNLSDLPLAYAFEKSLVDKWTFLENYIWLMHSIKLKKIDQLVKDYEGQNEYLLWIGFNSKKSFRILKRTLRKKPNGQSNI